MEFIRCGLDVDNIVKLEFQICKEEKEDHDIPIKFAISDCHYLYVYHGASINDNIYGILKDAYKSEKIIESLVKNRKIRIYYYQTESCGNHITRKLANDDEMKFYRKLIKLIEMRNNGNKKK
jgi:hypothetical protein